MKVRLIKLHSCDRDLTMGKVYECVEINEDGEARIYDDIGDYNTLIDNQYEIVEDQPKDEHYNNEKGSLYLFAEQHGLNAWEFDIIKRVVRCRKKGQFESDLEKTKRVIDLYLKESVTNKSK